MLPRRFQEAITLQNARDAEVLAALAALAGAKEAARLAALLTDVTSLGFGFAAQDTHKTIYCTASSYTLAATDVLNGGRYYKSTYIRMDTATANNVQITTELSGLEIGVEVSIRQVGAGVTTIVAGSGVVILPVDALVGRRAGSTMTIKKTDTNTWDVIGEMP